MKASKETCLTGINFGGSRSFTHALKCSLSVNGHVLTVHVYQISWEIGGRNAKTPAHIASAVSSCFPSMLFFPLPCQPFWISFCISNSVDSNVNMLQCKLLMLSKSNVTALLKLNFSLFSMVLGMNKPAE